MFAKEVFTGRIRKACSRMQGRDLLFLFSQENIFYFSGASIGPSERLAALCIFAKGRTTLICPGFEGERMKKESPVAEVHTWQEEENPYRLLESLIREEASSGGRIGLEGRVWFEVYRRMEERLKGYSFEDATALVDSLRMIKSEEELSAMEEACKCVLEGIRRALRSLEAGTKEADLAARIEQETNRLGGENSGALVQSGPNASFPHNPTGKREIQRGEAVVIDSGCRVNGYCADLTRTIFWGKVPPEVRECYRIVWEAQRAALVKVHPDLPAQDLDRAARRVIQERGYGKYFSHRLGHGIGLLGHEAPYLVEGNTLPLEEGMTFTVEPGIYLPGRFGIRLEDDVAVVPGGCRLLSAPVADGEEWVV